jgi:hypothetical protein
MTSTFSIGDRVATLKAIKDGLLDLDAVFDTDHRAGTSSNYVIVNSIPKSGTYLAVELIETFGEHVNLGYHVRTDGISKLNADGSMDPIRPVLDVLWSAALKPGQFCAAHLLYDPIIENYLLSRPDHKMIMMIRDPRDLVISWVDFVYNSSSYPKIDPWNAYLRQQGLGSFPDDFSQIMSTIEALPKSLIAQFFGWLASPACLVVRFEDLFSELSGASQSTPTLQRIADYLGVSSSKLGNAGSALGRGLTESGRETKVGAYLARMSEAHIEALGKEEFQKLIIGLGYEPMARSTDRSQTPTVEDRQGRRIGELEAEIGNLKSQLEEITNSKSWRITRPLRKFMTAFRAAMYTGRGN